MTKTTSPKSLYLHLPFCEKKCFYCSFVVAVGARHRMGDYVAAIKKESERYRATTVSTIYLGGGTPSMLSADDLRRLFQAIKDNFQYSADSEITIEANPENLDLDKARILLDLGVNRVSLGVQTFHDKYLRYLGRVHDSSKARSAFRDLRRAGFRNINVDLMFAFPDQTDAQLREDLNILLGLGSEHVSLYSLTIEENSRFYARQVVPKDPQGQSEQYELVVETLNAAGIAQYEVSNFSRPGLRSRHNINYWQGGNYIGLGIGAHSHCDGRRSWNVSRLSEYFQKVDAGLPPQDGFEVLTPRQRLSEALVFGLRMNEGVVLDELEKRFMTAFTQKDRVQIDELIRYGLLCQTGSYLQATAKGRAALDEIAVRLI